MEILILHPGALGDIILSLPALRLLRAHFPRAIITLAANLDFAGTVAGGFADRIISLSSLPLHKLYRSAPPMEDAPFWSRYDRIVCWTGCRDATFTRNFSLLHPHVLLSGWRPDAEERRHVSALFVDGLRPWIPEDPPVLLPAITVDAAALREGAIWLGENGRCPQKPLFALHCGAGSPDKRWPLSNCRGLARELLSIGDLLLIEGPAEVGLIRDLGLAGPGILAAQNLPLRFLASILKQADRFIGNDSGIAHLAAGLAVPSVVLFGPTNPAHWAPLGSQVTILRAAENCSACQSESEEIRHTCLEQIAQHEILAVMNCPDCVQASPRPGPHCGPQLTLRV